MTEPAIAAPATNSPLHQPARDNAGNVLPPLEAHTQKPDAPAPRAGAISDSEYDGLPPDQQSKYALVRKGPDGGSEWVARDQLGTEPATDSPAGAQKFKIGQYEVSEAELGAMMQRQAAEDLRKASLPASPEAYQATLPENFELPGGIKEITIDQADPLFVDARAYAFSRGMSQSEFSDLVGLYASSKARETAQLNAAHAAEVAKLGAN
jgi:hypothetical protein